MDDAHDDSETRSQIVFIGFNLTGIVCRMCALHSLMCNAVPHSIADEVRIVSLVENCIKYSVYLPRRYMKSTPALIPNFFTLSICVCANRLRHGKAYLHKVVEPHHTKHTLIRRQF